MPRDIRNVERGACIEGCRSCPNFLSVEPGRVLCDYCGCPPTKHELIQSHSLLAINRSDDYNTKFHYSKEISRVAELKNDGSCLTASRTSSSDSGCYMSSISIGSSSTTSASTSSCSPYISEEEGVDECFLPHGRHLYDEPKHVITPDQKISIPKLETSQESFSGVYSCPNHEMLVKIRSRNEVNHASHHLLNEPNISNSQNECDKDVKYATIATSTNPCKRRTYKDVLDIEESSRKALNQSMVGAKQENIVETVTEENSTLREMRQLEIDEKVEENDIRSSEENCENKIFRTEGDYDVSGHQHELIAGKIVCCRRSAL